jgi:hypothetical protein
VQRTDLDLRRLNRLSLHILLLVRFFASSAGQHRHHTETRQCDCHTFCIYGAASARQEPTAMRDHSARLFLHAFFFIEFEQTSLSGKYPSRRITLGMTDVGCSHVVSMSRFINSRMTIAAPSMSVTNLCRTSGGYPWPLEWAGIDSLRAQFVAVTQIPTS